MGGYGSAPRALNDSVLTVAENIKLTEKIFWMSFDAPELAVSARAGNCVFVYPSCGNDPMLGRPFAAADADPAVGRISVCYMVVGRGTAMLSAVKPGERLETGIPQSAGQSAELARVQNRAVSGYGK